MLNKEVSCLLLSHSKTQSILLAQSVVFGRCERRLDEFTFEELAIGEGFTQNTQHFILATRLQSQPVLRLMF